MLSVRRSKSERAQRSGRKNQCACTTFSAKALWQKAQGAALAHRRQGGLDLEAPGVRMLRTIAGPCVGIPADLRGPSGTRASLRDPRAAMEPASSGSEEGHAAPPRRLSRRGSIVAATAHGCAAAQGGGQEGLAPKGAVSSSREGACPRCGRVLGLGPYAAEQVAACRNVYQNQ